MMLSDLIKLKGEMSQMTLENAFCACGEELDDEGHCFDCDIDDLFYE